MYKYGSSKGNMYEHGSPTFIKGHVDMVHFWEAILRGLLDTITLKRKRHRIDKLFE